MSLEEKYNLLLDSILWLRETTTDECVIYEINRILEKISISL